MQNQAKPLHQTTVLRFIQSKLLHAGIHSIITAKKDACIAYDALKGAAEKS